MRANPIKAIKHTACAALGALLLASGASFASSVALTAAPTSTTLPDGQSVPMWGYGCSTTTLPVSATCAASNQNAGAGWSPVVITVPTGQPLTITLTNGLSFTTSSGTNTVPTSMVLVGQLGGGLGDVSQRTTTPSPVHPALSTTWPIAGTGPQFTPPAQPARVQSFATEVAAGATTALTWNNLKPGTYVIESGTHPSIQGPMGLYGVLVVTTAPSAGAAGAAYPGVAYDAEVPVLLSEIDAAQNRAVDTAVRTAGFSETKVWNGQKGQCGDPTAAVGVVNTCYPPAVNYDPRYYLINGVSFDRNNAANSALAVPATTPATSGDILLRFVNAGLRVHVPSLVGADMKLIAEDGTVQPDVALGIAKGLTVQASTLSCPPSTTTICPKIQNELFLAAGKTSDVIVTPAAAGGAYTAATLPIFDRELSLSTNNQRDGGMQAYLQVGGATALPASAAAAANPDTFSLVAGNPISVTDPSKGVMANDVGIYGVQVQNAPTAGTLVLNADGTFTYTPNTGTTSDAFTYCGNGSPTLCTTVTLAACTGTCLGAAPTANADAYSSNIASRLQISPPGVLANDIDPAGHPLTAAIVGAPVGGTVTLNADGSFTAAPAAAPAGTATATVTFQYNAVNSQHTASAAPATVTLTFKGGSGLAVAVKDAPNGAAITDYRWIIEEDRTFNIDPATQQNNGGTTPVPSLGTNFHTSYMPVVAQGCVGTVACESGQTVLDPTTNTHVPAVCDQGNGVCRTDASQQAPLDPGQVSLDPTKRYYISILPGDAGNTFA